MRSVLLLLCTAAVLAACHADWCAAEQGADGGVVLEPAVLAAAQKGNDDPDLSEFDHCRSDLNKMLTPAQYNITSTVMQMRSSTGKGNYVYGMPVGVSVDFGNWGRCAKLDNTRYCYVFHDIGEEHYRQAPAVGACVPNTCDEHALETLPTALVVSATGIPFSPLSPVGLKVECKPTVQYEDMPVGGIIWCAVVSMFAAIVLVATLVDCQTRWDAFPLARTLGAKMARENMYDIQYGEEEEEEESEGLVDRTTREFSGIYTKGGQLGAPLSAGEMAYLAADEQQGLPTNDVSDTYKTLRSAKAFSPLMMFSAIENTLKLIKPTPSSNTNALNGIRVLSMLWVILGHSYFYVAFIPLYNLSSLGSAIDRFRFHLIYGGFFAVDSFFLLSGFLVTYLFLLELRKKGMKVWTMPLFYFHRLWRLWPSVILTVFLYDLVAPYVFTSGPIHYFYRDAADMACDKWYTTLLFINNFWPVDQQCAGWLWYLANDMQFFVLSPIILLAFWKNKLVGIGIAAALVFVSILSSMVTAIVFQLDAFPMLNVIAGESVSTSSAAQDHEVLSNIYMLPWTRCAPYLVGMLVGFLLLERRSVRLLEKGVVRYVALSISGFVLVLLTFITYTASQWGWTQIESMFWLSFSRTSWALALGTWIYYLACGYIGGVNGFLGHPIWTPLARLSFGAYLFHIIFLLWFYLGFKAPIEFQTDVLICYFLFVSIGSYSMAYLNYLVIEKPFMNLEKFALSALLPR